MTFFWTLESALRKQYIINWNCFLDFTDPSPASHITKRGICDTILKAYLLDHDILRPTQYYDSEFTEPLEPEFLVDYGF